MPKTLRRRIYELVDASPSEDGSPPHFDWFDRFLALLIILNVAAVVIETVEPLGRRFRTGFHWFEVLSVAVFTAEYVLRLWSCTADPRYSHPITGRLRFALRPLVLVDLLAILPAYLPDTAVDLRFLRALRLLRILRVLKLGRYSDAAGVLLGVVKSRSAELAVMVVVLFVVLVLSSGVMYYVEHDAQPDRFSSIPAAMWWSVVTLTTIGYGDVYPITPLGRVLGGVIAVSGVGIVALPTAIIAAGFAEALRTPRQRNDERQGPLVCPHCGRSIEHDD